MTENTNMTHTQVADTTSSRGAQWAGAGSLIALAANSLLGGGNGGILGSILGGGNPGGGINPTTSLMMENAQLKADAATDKKLLEVYAALREQDRSQDRFAYSLDKRLSAIETAAPLREQLVLNKIDCVANAAQCGIAQNSTAITNLQNMVNSFVSIGVKNSSLCPGIPDVTLSFASSGN